MIKFRFSREYEQFDYTCDSEGEAHFTFLQLKLIFCNFDFEEDTAHFINRNSKHELDGWVCITNKEFDKIVKHMEQFKFEVVVDYI